MRPLNRTWVLLLLAACAALAQKPGQQSATPMANTPQAPAPHENASQAAGENASQDDVPIFTTDTRLVVVHASMPR